LLAVPVDSEGSARVPVRLLLVDDRPANLLALEAILEPLGAELVRAGSGEEAIAAAAQTDFAVVLLDVQMPGLDGFQTARALRALPRSRHAPIIFLTANDERENIGKAYANGAVDFLAKPLDASVVRAKAALFIELFEQRRTIAAHEVERLLAERRENDLREHNHLLTLDAEVGLALGTQGTTQNALGAVADALVRHLDAAFARIWTVSADGSTLELRASAGTYTHLDGPHGRVPVGQFKIGLIAAERKPHLTNEVLGDPRVSDQEWAQRERMVAFAGYPMVLGDRLIGVLAAFSRRPFSGASLVAMRTIASGVAQGIERRRAEDLVTASEGWLSTTLTSMGDGVIATDGSGRVTFLNPTAEALTAWTSSEAKGRLLGEIFTIVNEATRAAVESPVAKVLREGAVVGMANHTLLLRRDGSEIAIDDSAAPIRDAAGGIAGVVLVFRDASEKRRVDEERGRLLHEAKRAHGDAQAARDHLHGLFMQAPMPIGILRGPDHVFELTNGGYRKLMGDRDVIGMPVRQALPELAGQGFFELMDRVYATGERFVGKELTAKLTRGGPGDVEDVLLDVVYEPFRNRDGSVAGILAVATDVTERVRSRESMQLLLDERERLRQHAEENREKAEIASRMKDEFLTTASHELRTPLNAILGWAQLLRAGQADPSAYARGLETIERNAKAQVVLIEDILDGSRIITGKLHLEIRPLDMTALVHSALDAVRPAAEAKQIELRVDLEPAAARIVGDPDRLQQVVWNLANNAVKFTPKGGTIEVRLERSGTHIELSVRDSGQGISEDFLPHVFDRFRQAQGSTTRRHGGLGLGLALVRHLVEAHGGTVRAESEGAGLGARFVVLFPVQAVFAEQADSERPRPTTAAPHALTATSLTGITVLVVDDEADARDLVATALRARGAEVTLAASAAKALELMSTKMPMVLISDIGMPDTDGYTLIRRVRALSGSRGAHVPAIALTAYAREEDRRLALEAGFQTHVTKPVEPAELVRVVAGLVEFVGRQSSPARRQVALERADTFIKLEKILAARGVHEALRFLNSRTSHRFTGIFRFDGAILRNVMLVDSYAPEVTKGDDAPMTATYCAIVGETAHPFATDDARLDDRLRTHSARENVVSYCGVLLRDDEGKPFGTLCHFDFVAGDVPISEMPLMEAAAPLLLKAIQSAL
jgi:PAS domain S-box-containing protein